MEELLCQLGVIFSFKWHGYVRQTADKKKDTEPSLWRSKRYITEDKLFICAVYEVYESRAPANLHSSCVHKMFIIVV